MTEIQETQLYVLDRVGFFLAELEFATNPHQIEAYIYTIYRLSEKAYEKLHDLNHPGLVHPEVL